MRSMRLAKRVHAHIGDRSDGERDDDPSKAHPGPNAIQGSSTMNSYPVKPRTTDATRERSRRYQVWVAGSLTGSVDAPNPQEARAYAAQIYMAALRDVSVLPPY